MDEDTSATDEDRFDVLVDLARSHLLTDNLVDLRDVVHRAIEVAEQLGDLDREVEAVGLLSTNALWQTGSFGEVDELVVATAPRAPSTGCPPGTATSAAG